MLVLVATLLASIAPAPAACGDDGVTCEAVVPAPPAEAVDYATPAVVDCRSPAAPLALAAFVDTFVGECDGPSPAYDASYRASRSPDLQEVTRALRPAAARERQRALSTCGGLPPKGVDFTSADARPVALGAGTRLVLTWSAAPAFAAAVELPARFGDPPDRPPRV
ncbi:MAG TPA: hypothetical protein VHJ20_09365 [Polyangia bacterium]|nr:hypothetical protein [Polyangia bacterium]